MGSDWTLEELSETHEKAFLQIAGQCRLFDIGHPWSQVAFRKLVKDAEKERMDWRPKAGKVSVSRYVMVDRDKNILALGLMRFPLTAETEKSGGNLQVEVPENSRNRGFGSYCLALLLFEAVRAGLRRALVTASAKDPIARRIIEKNRGELIEEPQETARYWIRFS